MTTNIIICLKTSLLLLFSLTAAKADFQLIKDGTPTAVIVIPENISPQARKSVADFNESVKKCTSAQLPLVHSRQQGKNNIVIELEHLPVLENDRFSIEFPAKNIMNIRCTELSLRWAFNMILEDYFGVRQVFAKSNHPKSPIAFDNHFPEARNISMPEKEIEKSPAVSLYRMYNPRTWRWTPNWNMKEPWYKTHFLTVDVFPIHKYGADQSWPIDILPIINGKKIIPPKAKTPLPKDPWLAFIPYRSRWQPCWTNPKTAEIAIENILELLARHPEEQGINLDVNDLSGYCECAACVKAQGGRKTIFGHADHSEPYWKWVNTVAGAVAKKYPNVIFDTLAYREVVTPPPFTLHKNVSVRLCFELNAMLTNPHIAKQRHALLEAWSKKTSLLALYDYSHGMQSYLFIRPYTYSHSKLLQKIIKTYNLRGYYAESMLPAPFEGPLFYVRSKLLWDADTDIDASIREWCVAAVGERASPYLLEYYQLWEAYWLSDEIKKTVWHASSKNIYMQLSEIPSHTLALKKGDMHKLRSLLEKVYANTETEAQKNRAELLMLIFERCEAAATALFSEIVPPEGILADAQQAIDLMKALPEACRAIKTFENNPFGSLYKNYKTALESAMTSQVGLIMPFIKEPTIQKMLQNYIHDSSIPLLLRGQFKIWLGYSARNLVENGSFENATPDPVFWNTVSAERSNQFASDGRWSYKVKKDGRVKLCIDGVEPLKTYLVIFDVMATHTSAEGVFDYWLSPWIERKMPRHHNRFLNNKLNAGQWRTYSSTCMMLPKTNSLHILFIFSKYESGEYVYIDNIRVYCLNDLE